jgi:hypothetical protein
MPGVSEELQNHEGQPPRLRRIHVDTNAPMTADDFLSGYQGNPALGYLDITLIGFNTFSRGTVKPYAGSLL